MIDGILIYNEKDVEKNKAYINWLIEEGRKNNMSISLVLEKDLGKVENTYKFVLNRSRNFNITYKLEEEGKRVFNSYKFCIYGSAVP